MFEHSRDTFYVSDGISFSNLRFENDVEMYGAQALDQRCLYIIMFENDVEMYGAQASSSPVPCTGAFENDVEMYGAQANPCCNITANSLRMM